MNEEQRMGLAVGVGDGLIGKIAIAQSYYCRQDAVVYPPTSASTATSAFYRSNA